MTTLLTEQDVVTIHAANGLWLTAVDAERATGWQLKPEGMCRDDRCVPLPKTALRDNQVDLAAFWQSLGAPVVHDDAKNIWVLGASAEERNKTLAGSIVPDFTLPDLAGQPHTLSALRGKKVFLTTWASW
ncbi:MAG: redoxin domain-containing protein [Betaproteobacteria bacterium]|nr:redoxin domain-containing protein [Betaproteobacteria bacterium]